MHPISTWHRWVLVGSVAWLPTACNDGETSRTETCAAELRCAQVDPGQGGADASISLGTTPDALQPGYVDLSRMQALDVRSRTAFEAEHLPGARWLDSDAYRTTVDGVGGQLPAPDDVAAALSAAGVSPDLPALVYGSQSDLNAARMLWTLDVMGHPRVDLLDGGFDAWSAADLRVESGEAAHSASTYTTDALATQRRVEVAWVLEHLDDPDVQLIDARSETEYRAGHIPGALSLDWQGNVEAGRLLPMDALRARHAELPRDAILVTYCQTGSRAAMAYFVLRSLGYADVRLYDGSMAEWTQDSARPVEPG